MSFSATVYRVLIASPSDVHDERIAIPEAIHNWNYQNSKNLQVVLLPVMWETHAAPMMGRPQEVINSQLVRSCDMLIGCFWTRLGSPTGIAESGTVEEINWFVEQKKPVMLYFSRRGLPTDCELDQVAKVRDFKARLSSKGLLFDYENVQQLHAAVLRHLTTVVDNMTVSPTVNVAQIKRVDKKAESAAAKKGAAAGKSESDGSDSIVMCDYTDKAFVVAGNTIAYKEKFLALNGKWMKARDGHMVWMFAKKSKLDQVAKLLNIEPNLSPYPPSP